MRIDSKNILKSNCTENSFGKKWKSWTSAKYREDFIELQSWKLCVSIFFWGLLEANNDGDFGARGREPPGMLVMFF